VEYFNYLCSMITNGARGRRAFKSRFPMTKAAFNHKDLLSRVTVGRNILQKTKRRKVTWVGHMLRRNCLLKHVMGGKGEGRIYVTRRWWRRSKQLLDDLKEKIGYWKLKEEALDRTVWRKCFGRGYRPVVGQAIRDVSLSCDSTYIYVFRHRL